MIGIYGGEYPKANIPIIIRMNPVVLKSLPDSLKNSLKRAFGISGKSQLDKETLSAKDVKCSIFTAIYLWNDGKRGQEKDETFYILYHGFIGGDYLGLDVKRFKEFVPMGVFDAFGITTRGSGEKDMPKDEIRALNVHLHSDSRSISYSPDNAQIIFQESSPSISTFWAVAFTKPVEERRNDIARNQKGGTTDVTKISDLPVRVRGQRLSITYVLFIRVPAWEEHPIVNGFERSFAYGVNVCDELINKGGLSELSQKALENFIKTIKLVCS
jgi:hypothetical protein